MAGVSCVYGLAPYQDAMLLFGGRPTPARLTTMGTTNGWFKKEADDIHDSHLFEGSST